MKIWDVEKNEIPSLSEYLKIGKGSVVQIAGSGGKTSLTYAVANENPDLKCAILTTTKRIRPDDGFVLQEGEVIDLSKAEGNLLEAGVLSEDERKIGWVGDDNYKLIKGWADLVIIEADGSKRLPLKACNPDEPVWVPDATHTIVLAGMSALGKQLGETCHRYNLLEHIWQHYKTVTVNEIAWLLKKYYVNRFRDLDIFVFLNQCDDEELLDMGLKILKTNRFSGAAGRILEN